MRAAAGPAGPLVLALLRRCLLLGPLALRAAAGQDGDGCGHTVLGPQSGTLSSRNYPGTYPNHTRCRWRLRAPPGASLLLAVADVDVEAAEGCAGGSLLLAEPARGVAHGPYCRGAHPGTPLLVTNASAITVLFNSSSHRSGRGVLLSYATSEHPDLVSCLVKGTHYTQEHVSVYCPAGCKGIAGDIWGNERQGYRDTSVLCKAAVHAGVITDERGGRVALWRRKGLTLYEAAVANGLRSKRGSLSEKRLVFHKACTDVLDVAAFSASSSWLEEDALGQRRAWGAAHAALGTPGPSWAPALDDEAAWLQLDLGTRRNVTGIITKGSSEGPGYYVTSYSVSWSRDGRTWRGYRGSGAREDKLFEGNADGAHEASNAFLPALVARYVRVAPRRWHRRAALQVALLGCAATRAPPPPPPYVPGGPSDVPASHVPVPGVVEDPKQADPSPGKREATHGRERRRHEPYTEPGARLAEYAEPRALPAAPSGAHAAAAPPDEGYALPAGHYAVPCRPHEYAEPLPPEPEYAMPFGDAGHEGRPPAGPMGYEAPSARDPAPRGLPRPEASGSAGGDGPLAHVYHEVF
ncbi:discoidin, CUB and LCCL domain-containing protein 1-like [Eudromia elegans]